MKVSFHKYQGTGNDFIMIDNRDGKYADISNDEIRQFCDRRFGIGADGLILINNHPSYSFEMRYHNSDGSQSFCGNGARCAVAFAHKLNLFADKAKFEAIDGQHEAQIIEGLVYLKMNDVLSWDYLSEDTYVFDTGSPHYIRFVSDLKQYDIYDFGRSIRYNETYRIAGINVNLVTSDNSGVLSMLTYERGVEAETFSCGTGATAVALSEIVRQNKLGQSEINLTVKGGELKVKATFDGEKFVDIYLIGPAKHVFNGSINR